MDLSSRLAVWQQLAESCGVSTVQQGLQQVWRLLLLCLICRLCFRLGGVSTVKHVVSVLAGMYGLFLFFELHMLWVLLLSVLCYLVLLLSRHSSSRGLFLSIVILIYLLIGTSPVLRSWPLVNVTSPPHLLHTAETCGALVTAMSGVVSRELQRPWEAPSACRASVSAGLVGVDCSGEAFSPSFPTPCKEEQHQMSSSAAVAAMTWGRSAVSSWSA